MPSLATFSIFLSSFFFSSVNNDHLNQLHKKFSQIFMQELSIISLNFMAMVM